MYEVIIVGGSAAGLSAALVLGRFRRRVLICDHQKPRNAPAEAAHNFFTRDGTPPAELLQIGREQLRPYQTVEHCTAEVVSLTPVENGFDVKTADGAVWQSRRVLLATGVHDELPTIPGLADYWGKGGVHHCPYCHGWEVRDQKIVIIGNGEVIYHLAVLLSALSSDISACLYGEPQPTPDQLHKLQQMGVTLYDAEIEAIEGDAGQVQGIRLGDGRLLPCQAIFAATKPQQHSTLARDIGCQFNEQGYVQVDILGRTSVPNVYAAGDMVTPFHQLIAAAASGTAAGSGINTDIVFPKANGDSQH
jgi:thioredoxin reductase